MLLLRGINDYMVCSDLFGGGLEYVLEFDDVVNWLRKKIGVRKLVMLIFLLL